MIQVAKHIHKSAEVDCKSQLCKRIASFLLYASQRQVFQQVEKNAFLKVFSNAVSHSNSIKANMENNNKGHGKVVIVKLVKKHTRKGTKQQEIKSASEMWRLIITRTGVNGPRILHCVKFNHWFQLSTVTRSLKLI